MPIHRHLRARRLACHLNDAGIYDKRLVLHERSAPVELHLYGARLVAGLLHEKPVRVLGVERSDEAGRLAERHAVKRNVAPLRLGDKKQYSLYRAEYRVLADCAAFAQKHELVDAVVVRELEPHMAAARREIVERKRRDAARHAVDNHGGALRLAREIAAYRLRLFGERGERGKCD